MRSENLPLCRSVSVTRAVRPPRIRPDARAASPRSRPGTTGLSPRARRVPPEEPQGRRPRPGLCGPLQQGHRTRLVRVRPKSSPAVLEVGPRRPGEGTGPDHPDDGAGPGRPVRPGTRAVPRADAGTWPERSRGIRGELRRKPRRRGRHRRRSRHRPRRSTPRS